MRCFPCTGDTSELHCLGNEKNLKASLFRNVQYTVFNEHNKFLDGPADFFNNERNLFLVVWFEGNEKRS